MRGFLLAMAIAIGTSGCNRQSVDVNEVFPLGVGHDWVYEVVHGQEKTASVLEFHILEEGTGDRGEHRYFLDEKKSRYYLRHGDVIAYSITPEIWTVFLDGPLKTGTRFDGGLATEILLAGEPRRGPEAAGSPAPTEMHAVKSAGYKLVTALKRKITVPAGTFEDCVEVTHIAGPTTGVKYFAPGVGMVFAEAFFDHPETKKRSLVTRQQLAYFRVGKREGGTRPGAVSTPVDTPVPVPLVTTSSAVPNP